jgi:hypothetical protein
LRYRILHNQIDLVLSAALRGRDDIVVARVTVPLEPPADAHKTARKVEPQPESESESGAAKT